MDEVLSRITEVARDSGGRSRLYRWMWRNRASFSALLDENRPRWQALADGFAEMGLAGPDGLKAESVRNTWWRVRRDQANRRRPALSPAPAVVVTPVIETPVGDPLAALRSQMKQRSGLNG